MIPSAVFVVDVALQNKLQNSSANFLKKSLEHAKDVDTCFVDLGKCTTGFLVKSFGVCHGSTVFTGVSCWLSSNCILAQKFASTELHNNGALLVLDSDNDGVYCHYYS